MSIGTKAKTAQRLKIVAQFLKKSGFKLVKSKRKFWAIRRIKRDRQFSGEAPFLMEIRLPGTGEKAFLFERSELDFFSPSAD